MVNLKSLPHEVKPGSSYNRLPYAVMRNVFKNKYHQSDGCEVLRFNAVATRLLNFKKGEKVNLYWDSDNLAVGIMRGGNQRKITIWGEKGSWSTIYITSLVRMYQLPFHRHPLPVSQDPDGNVWVDFSGEKADVKYLPERVRPKDASVSFAGKRIARLCARLEDNSHISNKSWPTYVEMFQEVSRAEGFNSFSKWVDMVLSHYVQDHHPHLWETYMNLKSGDKN
jgi:hypothetical protein